MSEEQQQEAGHEVTEQVVEKIDAIHAAISAAFEAGVNPGFVLIELSAASAAIILMSSDPPLLVKSYLKDVAQRVIGVVAESEEIQNAGGIN